MDIELKKFRDLITAIYEHHERPHLYSHVTARSIFDRVQGAFPGFRNRDELLAMLPSEEAVQKEFGRTLLYLNPVTHGTLLVPALSVKSDFGRSIPEIRLYLAVFLEHDGVIKFFGFRFEAPEGSGSIHHYYHLQMIRNLPYGVALPDDKHSQFGVIVESWG